MTCVTGLIQVTVHAVAKHLAVATVECPQHQTYANDVNSYRHVAHVIAGFQTTVSATIRKDAKHA